MPSAETLGRTGEQEVTEHPWETPARSQGVVGVCPSLQSTDWHRCQGTGQLEGHRGGQHWELEGMEQPRWWLRDGSQGWLRSSSCQGNLRCVLVNGMSVDIN